MQFMDTHIHLQDFKATNATNIINEGAKLAIDSFICASIIEDDWALIADLYEQYPHNIIPAFGLHPWYTNEAKRGWEERLSVFLQKYPTALLGEVGLDRHYDKNTEPQNSFFATQLRLSQTFARPLLIHAVHCNDWFEQYWDKLPPKFVFHSYNGRKEFLQRIIAHDGYVSFSPSILKNRDKVEVIKTVPANRLLLETDAPYQGEIIDIPNLCKEIASVRGVDVSALSAQIYQNSKEFINVK